MTATSVREVNMSPWAIASCVIQCGWTDVRAGDVIACREAAIAHTTTTGHETAVEARRSTHYLPDLTADRNQGGEL